MASAFAVLSPGCKTAEPLPVYPAMPFEQAWEVMHERDRQVRSVRGACRIVIVTEGDERITLDGAFAADDQLGLRLQAWKLGKDVFDLTHNAEGTFAWSDEQRLEAADGQTTEQGQPDLDDFAVLLKLFVELPDLRGASLLADHDRAWRVESGDRVALVNHQTLTVRALTSSEEQRGDLVLGYEPVDGVARVTRLRLNRPPSLITVTLLDPAYNTDIAASVFQPPARAQRIGEP